MLTKQELSRIYRHAYLPEHLPHYVEPFSAAKAYFIEDHLCYYRRGHLIFIGYPLGIDACDSEQAYLAACEHFQPSTAAILAPQKWSLGGRVEIQPEDHYYGLKLPLSDYDSGVAYMIRRAEKELSVGTGNFGREHRKLVKSFISARRLSSEQEYIFNHIRHYLKSCRTARLLEARGKKGVLAAFTIVDLGSADYAFYLFSFRSDKVKVPGAADLLLRELATVAEAAGKKMVNLGLGINDGIRHFKEKWGGAPFLSYNSMLVRKEELNFADIAKKL